MPYLTLPNRRDFLRSVLAGAATLRVATPQSKSSTTRWAFLSDTHIPADPANVYRGFQPYENLKAVVPEVVRAATEGVVIDGDLARLEGLPGDYRNFKNLLRPLTDKLPVCMSLGNHDDRRNFLGAFTEPPAQRQQVKGKYVLAVEQGPVRLILLDSLMRANFTPGFLGEAQRTWLEQYLKRCAPLPTLVFVHHTLDDGDNSLLDVERMFRILRPQKMVKAVVYGHSHRYAFDKLDGIHLINIPAVGYNFTDSEPVGWAEAALSADGGDFKLHAIGGNTAAGGQLTSVSWRG